MHPHLIASAHPDRPAVITEDGDTLSYRELAQSAWRIARAFGELALRPGDHLAICMDNRPETLQLLWGAHSAGLLYTACPTGLTSRELAYIVNDCGARVFIASAALSELAEQVADITPGVTHRFSVGGAIPAHLSFEELWTHCRAEPLADAVAGADMLYSSGTTGRPKGIEPNAERTPLIAQDLYTGVAQRAMAFDDGNVYLSPAPLYHAAPLRGCMSVHRLGGTVALMRRFDPETVLRLIERHRVTHSQFVPTMFIRMLRLAPEVRSRYDLSSLRSVIHASAPCPPEVKRAMIEWWGPIINEYYGGTEACGSTWITSEEWLQRPGSVGRANVGRLHILGDDGTELPAGEIGTIYFSDGPEFHYHDDPAKTAAAHTAEGWATCGDIGWLDEQGYLYLTDRHANMIISGGVNVYPQEAENALAAHPLVLDAAVFGIPDEDLIQQVKAVVVPVEMPADAGAAAELERVLLLHCRRRLAGYKCPRSIDFREELPRLETGKLLKRLLVEEYGGGALR